MNTPQTRTIRVVAVNYAGTRPNGDTEYELLYRASWLSAGTIIHKRYIDGPTPEAAVTAFVDYLNAFSPESTFKLAA